LDEIDAVCFTLMFSGVTEVKFTEKKVGHFLSFEIKQVG
jgi:hypothetical protein